MRKLRIIALFFSILLLTGCASKPPLVLQLPETEKTVSLYSNDLKPFIGSTVRWGGIIIETKNNKDTSQIVILAYPLDNRARPNTIRNTSTRRFIAEFKQFIEPTNYSEKREITIIGKLDRIEESKIGDFNYKFPIVSVEKHLLWANRSNYDYDPYYYDNYNYWYGYSPYYYPFYWQYDRHHRHFYYY